MLHRIARRGNSASVSCISMFEILRSDAGAVVTDFDGAGRLEAGGEGAGVEVGHHRACT
jgi:hypothetical protein